MQTGPDDGGSEKDAVQKAIDSVPKGISKADAQTLKDVKEGKK
jgi:hypothetical protein